MLHEWPGFCPGFFILRFLNSKRIEKFKMKKQTKISSLIDKACFDYNLIEDGDKILVGASGGKDSTVLTKYFSQRIKRPSCNFEYKAVFVQSDFSQEFPEEIHNFFKDWLVPFEILKVDVIARLKEGKKKNCWWCSTQRRTELLNYAIKNGFNKIALAHHMDDILETLLMNALNKGEFSTMPPKLKYQNYPVTIIRPLCYATENQIILASEIEGFSKFTCTCDFQENSERKEARKLLGNLCNHDEAKKKRLFYSLKKIQPLYLP